MRSSSRRFSSCLWIFLFPSNRAKIIYSIHVTSEVHHRQTINLTPPVIFSIFEPVLIKRLGNPLIYTKQFIPRLSKIIINTLQTHKKLWFQNRDETNRQNFQWDNKQRCSSRDFLKRHRFNIINNSYFSRCDPARKYSDFSMKPYWYSKRVMIFFHYRIKWGLTDNYVYWDKI